MFSTYTVHCKCILLLCLHSKPHIYNSSGTYVVCVHGSVCVKVSNSLPTPHSNIGKYFVSIHTHACTCTCIIFRCNTYTPYYIIIFFNSFSTCISLLIFYFLASLSSIVLPLSLSFSRCS